MGNGRRVLVVVAVALGVMLSGAAPASAHNALTGSDPEDGAEVAQGPDEVALSFLASLDPDGAELAVTGPDGLSAIVDDPQFDGSSVTLPVATGLAGDYLVSYEVLSTDGHWVDGTIEFTVTEGEQPPEPTPTPAAATSDPPAVAEPTPTLAARTAADSGGTSWWIWLLVAAAALAAAGGLVAYRRRSSST